MNSIFLYEDYILKYSQEYSLLYFDFEGLQNLISNKVICYYIDEHLKTVNSFHYTFPLYLFTKKTSYIDLINTLHKCLPNSNPYKYNRLFLALLMHPSIQYDKTKIINLFKIIFNNNFNYYTMWNNIIDDLHNRYSNLYIFLKHASSKGLYEVINIINNHSSKLALYNVISKYKQQLITDAMCSNEYISLDFILEHKNICWNINVLSQHTKIDIHSLLNNSFTNETINQVKKNNFIIKTDNSISNNINNIIYSRIFNVLHSIKKHLPINILQQYIFEPAMRFSDKYFNFHLIYYHENITPEIITIYQDLPWSIDKYNEAYKNLENQFEKVLCTSMSNLKNHIIKITPENCYEALKMILNLQTFNISFSYIDLIYNACIRNFDTFPKYWKSYISRTTITKLKFPKV